MEIFWIAIAYILGLVASHLGLPPLVGYLVGGFILGEWNIGENPTIHAISDIGVLLLLFSVGLKINIRSLLRWEVLGVGFSYLIISSVGSILLLLLAGTPLLAAIFLGLGLSFSSTVFAAKTLEEKGSIGAFHGRLAIGILVLQDLVAVTMLVFIQGSSFSPWILAFLISVPIIRLFLRSLLTWSGHKELLLLYGLLITLGGSEAFKSLGLSGELGALVAGMLLTGHLHTEELSKTLWGLKEVFLVGFFLQIGFGGLPGLHDGIWILLFTVLLPLRVIIYFFLGIFFQLKARTAFLTTLALSSYSEFTLIVGAAAVKSNILPATWLPVLALLVTASLIIAAPLNKMSYELFTYFEKWLISFERKIPHPEGEAPDIRKTTWLIVGMGQSGTAAYDFLAQKHQRVQGLDSDLLVVQQQQKQSRQVNYGDAEDPDLLNKINLKPMIGIILGMPELATKLHLAQKLRQNDYSGIVAAMSLYPEEDSKLYNSGINLISHPFADVGERLAERALAQKRLRHK
ncbi:cation:proton antiporter [Candidatus Nitrosacidococcus sp. I8]|uniref:cation:proton antiporter n=1 Tax=Candidatus Nitrosacidococcus sp. I8 TaxID=2942908 RepID=UPI0022277EC8|nr:cation:proton antiporter [Candidatus Nitrosacidococcus sp. I8]CAH9019884.1 Glutathione-regulated potassium-efflux system protein KefC [Candidatus Nitrosacidococcus sp. I8]